MTLKRFFRGIRVGFECILRLPWINWFNPVLTLYLNFRSFPLKQAVKLPVFVYGWPKLFSLLGSMECKDVCKTGMVKFNKTSWNGPSSPGLNTSINNWGKIIFHGSCLIHTGIHINIFRFGILELGKKTHIMPNCNITAWKFVYLGSNSRLAHRCQIIDSNYHYIANFEKNIVKNHCSPIYIGDNVWICNSCSISAGAKIPSNIIVASNSLVKKNLSNIPEYSVIGGSPAKLLREKYGRIYNRVLENEIGKYFDDHPEAKEFLLGDNFEPGSTLDL